MFSELSSQLFPAGVYFRACEDKNSTGLFGWGPRELHQMIYVRIFPNLQGGPGSVRFGCGSGVERFERFRFSVPRFLCKKGFSVFQYSLTGKSEIPPVLLGIPWPALKGPLRNQFWKKRRPQPYWGGENSGNALEASNALNYRVWGIPAVLSREIPGNALRAFPGSFRSSSGISSGKSQPYWGCGPERTVPVSVPGKRFRRFRFRFRFREKRFRRFRFPVPVRFLSETGIGGGSNVLNARGGGELAPKVAPRRLGLVTPTLATFYRISSEKGQIQGPLKIQNFHPPSNFRRFDPPYPGLQSWATLNLWSVFGDRQPP